MNLICTILLATCLAAGAQDYGFVKLNVGSPMDTSVSSLIVSYGVNPASMTNLDDERVGSE